MTENNHDWAIILAAGGSIRFGSAKALAAWKGGTLLSNIIKIAKHVFSDRIIVVTGGYAEQIQKHLGPDSFIFNNQWQNGIGTSIAAGTAEVLKRDPLTKTITILPVDQPFISFSHIEKIVAASKSNMCVLSNDDKISGPPATIPSVYFPQLLTLNSTKGVKSFLGSEKIKLVAGQNVLKDIDTIEDLKEALRIESQLE